MKANQLKTYDGAFPEQFNWGMVDSVRLSALALDLADEIKRALGQPVEQRIIVPGLRLALCRIAAMSDV